MPSHASTHPERLPKQTALTQAVATGGRAALDQRAQAASYGRTGQQQALRDLYNQIATTGTGSSAHPADTGRYEQWQQSQGFRPQNYDVTFGRTDEGKFSGFKTEGELKAAILGSSELRREREMEQADVLKDETALRLQDLGSQYDTQAATVPDDVGEIDVPLLGRAVKGRRFGADVPEAQVVQEQGVRNQDFLGRLDEWYKSQGEPLVEGMETANQIEQTPTREYALAQAAQYGVDPALAAGWFPMASQVSDAATQRDLESLRDTGLPYSEQQSTIGALGRETEQNTAQAAADDKLRMADDIYGVTSYPGDQLAQSVDAPLEAVHDITTNPNFQGYASNVEGALAQAEAANPRTGNTQQDNVADNNIAQAVDEAIAAATSQVMQDTGDPNTAQVLERILRALYGNI